MRRDENMARHSDRKQFSVMLDQEVLEELERRALKSGRSVGEEIRRIIATKVRI